MDALLVLLVILCEVSALGVLGDGHQALATGANAVGFSAGFSLITGFSGLYGKVSRLSEHQLLTRAVVASLLAVPLAIVIFVLVPGAADAPWLPFAAVSGAVAVVMRRASVARRAAGTETGHRILVFGTGAAAVEVANCVKAQAPEITLVGFYPGPTETQGLVQSSQLLATQRSLIDTAQALNVDEIVVAVSERRAGSMPLRELLDCRLRGIRVFDLATFFERLLGQIRIEYTHAGWLVFGGGFRRGRVRAGLKRAFDVVCSLFLLLLALPVMAAAAIAIKFESRGPLIYRQERVGLRGRCFTILKFRSMTMDAEVDGRPRWATANDARVTRVGRLIRLCRIDELPQLVNVLRGDMSLVGPRPERPYFVEQLTERIPYFQVRHSVRPGLTGWAQVSYAYASSVDDALRKLQFDLYYVKNHSLFLDIIIMFRTVVVVLTGKGAC
ncbi:MAG: TIGR03013 family XrtA/PEP-CTERM system glycosyltransferase [Aquabacterium sp.]